MGLATLPAEAVHAAVGLIGPDATASARGRRVRLRRAVAWDRYAVLADWSTWAPLHLRRRRQRISVGRRADRNRPRSGRHCGWLFVVDEVTIEPARSWRWTVRNGPVTLRLGHEVLARPRRRHRRDARPGRPGSRRPGVHSPGSLSPSAAWSPNEAVVRVRSLSPSKWPNPVRPLSSSRAHGVNHQLGASTGSAQLNTCRARARGQSTCSTTTVRPGHAAARCRRGSCRSAARRRRPVWATTV